MVINLITTNLLDKIVYRKINGYYKLFDLHFVVKRLVFIFLLFLPFQNIIVMLFEQFGASVKFISNFDEVFSIVVLFAVIVFFLIKPNYFRFYLDYPFTKFLLMFFIITFFSIIFNQLRLIQGLFGIYDIIKNLSVLFIMSSLNWRREELQNIVLLVIRLGLFLAIAGVITEILALSFNFGLDWFVSTQKRFGMYRTLSIVGPGNGNYLALYCILSLFLVLQMLRGSKRIFYSLILILCIFLTFSRQALISLILLATFFVKRKQLKYLIGFLLSTLIISLIIIMTYLSDEKYEPDVYYRTFTILKSLEILKNNLFLGSGPGTFGGVASIIFKSNLYDDWPSYFKEMVERMGSIDAFWPAVAAETGVLGFLFLFLFMISLYMYLNNLSKNIKNQKHEIYKIGLGISRFVLVLIIMNFFTGFNKAFLVYTFFTLCGAFLSFYRNYKQHSNLKTKEQLRS